MFTIKPTIKTTLASRNFNETRPFSRNQLKFTPRENNPLYGTSGLPNMYALALGCAVPEGK